MRATNERTEIFSLEKTINGYPKREKKSGLGQKWKFSTVDIRIKKSGLKFIHSKVPRSGKVIVNWNHYKTMQATIDTMFVI